MGDRCREQSGSRQHAGVARHQNAANVELDRERGCMQTAGAAERHKGKIARIMPAIDRDEANAVSHVRVGDTIDPERGRW